MPMIEGRLLGLHIAAFAEVLGAPVAVPTRPPEGDPEYGLSRYVELPERGISIVIDWDDIAECVQFYGNGKDPAYKPYKGDLPSGLSFQSSREDVRAKLGEPIRHDNSGKIVPILGAPLPWDWFLYEGRKLHFEYSESCRGIRMVSLALLPET